MGAEGDYCQDQIFCAGAYAAHLTLKAYLPKPRTSVDAASQWSVATDNEQQLK